MANEVQATVRVALPLVVIDLVGEVTNFAEDAITGAYRDATAQGGTNILLNFAGVDYLNSSGIAVIIGVLTEARQAGQRLLVSGLSPHYQKIFQMMGLSQYAPVYESEDAARRATQA